METAAPLAGPENDWTRWRMLGMICAGVVLCMTTWFSATAIVPELTQLWSLSSGQVAWLTNAVQLGFVTGCLAFEPGEPS